MKKYLLKLKQYKKALIALGAVLVVALLFLLAWDGGTGILLPPRSIREQPVIPQTANRVYLTEAVPPSGSRKTPDTFASFYLEFSEPIDINSVKVTAKPFINLDLRVFEHSPNRLYIMPKVEPWEKGTQYVINLISLRSTSGNILNEAVRYIYHYEIPSPDELFIGEPPDYNPPY